jgi:hypothetical protein
MNTAPRRERPLHQPEPGLAGERGHPDARRLVGIHVVDCVGNGMQFSTLALYLNRESGLRVRSDCLADRSGAAAAGRDDDSTARIRHKGPSSSWLWLTSRFLVC